jgi:TonB dependent receptor
MPINMPTHAHGQGYTDLNFLIPELVEGIDYRKGPYYAEQGDFASAGAATMRYFTTLPKTLATLESGQYDYLRATIIHSVEVGPGRLILALEGTHQDGPWDVAENFVRMNGVLRYAVGDARNGWDVTLMGYRGDWSATDQVPREAVRSGLIDRFGTLDPTTGGSSHRDSLSASWRSGDARSVTRVNAYLIEYKLDLVSNFTYFLQDPVRGDQFEQFDHRFVVGAAAAHQWFDQWFGIDVDNEVGLQTRNDIIPEVSLHKTEATSRYQTVRDDRVLENSLGLYLRNRAEWTPWFRSEAGLRGDVYWFDVDSSLKPNSGSASDGLASPKLSLIFGPWEKTEFYLNGGLGFHSNDARGTTIKVDPSDGVTPVSKVDPLVRTKGADVGVRTATLEGLQSTLSGFILDIDSELLFVGDAGITEPSLPSRRTGIEIANYYAPLPWLSVDADVAYTWARFRDADPAGRHIPGAIEGVFSGGISIHNLDGFLASLRVRYFGPRPLIEDNSVRSDGSTLVNARVGYEYKSATLALEVFNLFNAKADDIAYFYRSQSTPGGTPADDVHVHPAEPRTFRLSLTLRF